MLTRRNFFGFLSALGAAAVPVAAKSEPTASPVQPIILEHTCDAGWSTADAEHREYWEKLERESGKQQRYRGCGTIFRWHFGVPAVCPKCTWMYDTRLDLIKQGVYRVVQGRIPE